MADQRVRRHALRPPCFSSSIWANPSIAFQFWRAHMTRNTRNALVLVLVVLGGAMFGLSAQQRGAQPPAAPAAAQPQETTPPLLFKEIFQQVDAGKGVPTSPRRSNNQYWLAGQ